ncbi:CoA-binding protein, partial [Streptococcus danieliae]|nr:CoA-binding protein [Streptococcus danieliae]
MRNLDKLFKPASVALIGATAREHKLGAIALSNLLGGGDQGAQYKGDIWPVNPKYDELMGLKCYRKLAHLPKAPDLAIICTPPATITALIRDLGALGTRAAIVMTSGLDPVREQSLRLAMLKAAKPHLLRILGPNSMGLLVPKLGLNASFAHLGATSGKIAFVSQSGALVSGVLDWANAHGVGFSKFISLGGS